MVSDGVIDVGINIKNAIRIKRLGILTGGTDSLALGNRSGADKKQIVPHVMSDRSKLTSKRGFPFKKGLHQTLSKITDHRVEYLAIDF